MRDCVGYRSVGHGFFLEDGTEVDNILDGNLAVQAFEGKPLPGQVLTFDRNEGAGFWWANSLNAFMRNMAVECDQYGFRYEAPRRQGFDGMLAVRGVDACGGRWIFARCRSCDSRTTRRTPSAGMGSIWGAGPGWVLTGAWGMLARTSGIRS